MSKLTDNTVTDLERLREITHMIELMKETYAEYDQIIERLVAQGFHEATHEGHYFALTDNYANKNTVFRACGIKRWEIKIIPQPAG